MCVYLCLDVFFLKEEEEEEAEGNGVTPTSTLGDSGRVCVCVCALYVKWRQGENRSTGLYNGVRTQPASRSLHLSAAAPRHTRTHTHSHTLSWPTDLTRPAVICHLATNWAVSAGLLLASGLMVIRAFEGRPIQSHG